MRDGVILLMFDVPGQTKPQRRQYARFYKNLKLSGYQTVQKSVYVKNLHNISSAGAELNKLTRIAPEHGDILALPMSMNQFRSFVTILGDGIDFASYFDDVVCF